MDWLDYYYPHFHPAESETTRFGNVKLVMKLYKTCLLRRVFLAKTNAKKHAFCPIFLPFLVLFYISFYPNCCNLWLFAILFRVLVEVFHRPRNRFFVGENPYSLFNFTYKTSLLLALCKDLGKQKDCV